MWEFGIFFKKKNYINYRISKTDRGGRGDRGPEPGQVPQGPAGAGAVGGEGRSERAGGEGKKQIWFWNFFTKHFFGLPPHTKCREFLRREFPLHMCLRGFFIFFLKKVKIILKRKQSRIGNFFWGGNIFYLDFPAREILRCEFPVFTCMLLSLKRSK